MSELSDELLVAYVDGQLARDQSAAVKGVVEFDDVSNKRVAGLRRANARLEEAFEAMLREHRDVEDEPEEQPAESEPDLEAAPIGQNGLAIFLSNHGALVLAGGALSVLLLGVGAGYLISTGGMAPAAQPVAASNKPEAPAWQKEVALTQGMFSREALEVSLESQANPDLVRFQLASVIGPSLALPDLESEGLRFMRGQILRSSGEPIAQISYLPEKGPPIALYAKAESNGQTGLGSLSQGDVRTRAWVHEGIAYVLAAALSGPEMDALADKIKGVIASQ
jgi:anti-sigma factor RsiW